MDGWPYGKLLTPLQAADVRREARQAQVLEQLRDPQWMGRLPLVCNALGLRTGQVRQWMDRDPEFRAQVEAVQEVIAAAVEATLIRSAVEGDVAAAKAVLAAERPEKYGTKLVEVRGQLGSPAGNDILAVLLARVGAAETDGGEVIGEVVDGDPEPV